MTYVGWEKDDRRPENFAEVERAFLGNNPWIGNNLISLNGATKECLKSVAARVRRVSCECGRN